MLASSRRETLRSTGERAEGEVGTSVLGGGRKRERSEKTRLNFEKVFLFGADSDRLRFPVSSQAAPNSSFCARKETSSACISLVSYVSGHDCPFEPASALGSVPRDDTSRSRQATWHQGSQSGEGLYHLRQKYWKLKRNDWGDWFLRWKLKVSWRRLRLIQGLDGTRQPLSDARDFTAAPKRVCGDTSAVDESARLLSEYFPTLCCYCFCNSKIGRFLHRVCAPCQELLALCGRLASITHHFHYTFRRH